jgi:KipI family sensor histidine kinase inhibitor
VKIRSAGPAAWYVDVADAPSPETALRLGALQRALLASAPATVRDVVPGYTSLLVEFRPGTSPARLQRWLDTVDHGLEHEAPAATRRRVEVRYGADADSRELTARLGLPWERIVALHAGALYTVAFLGFTPGFPYLLGLPRALVTPRRETPRMRVPAGSVAIAGDHAGIYPSASPGGWWIVGRTDEPLFDPHPWPPRAWAPGDEVRFVAVGPGPDAPAAGGPPTPRPARGTERATLGDAAAPAVLEVVEAWAPSATLQAGPRWRVGHLGMAQAGALDPLALEFANAAAGNAADAPALELLALPLTLRALEPVTAALMCGGHRARLDGRPQATGEPFAWPAGAVLELVPGGRAHGRASYLALAGGIAAERYGGSASTDLRAGVGGGRHALRPGDLLGTGAARGGRAAGPSAYRPRYPERLLLRVHRGPQYDPETFARLTASRFRVAGFDRTGVRLEGPPLPQSAPDVRSEGSPWGALQLPADGHPIVLLADRGRTGGYAKPAVVDVRELWRLAQAPLGTVVEFAAADAT